MRARRCHPKGEGAGEEAGSQKTSCSARSNSFAKEEVEPALPGWPSFSFTIQGARVLAQKEKFVRHCAVLLSGLFFLAETTRADWTQFALPNLSGAFGPYTMSHLSDGRYVYAESGQFYQQASFGSAGYIAFGGEPAGLDPSFISIRNDGFAAAGSGGFGSSAIWAFDPSNPTTPNFAQPGAVLQNFQGVFRDDVSLYVSGLYEGFTHGVQYAALDGSVTKLIIGDVATFSAGMALDGSGNLFVGDTDDGKVYKFTAAQLAAAIAGSALTTADGQLVHDFGSGGNIGSLAVDGLGNVWAAGYLHNGLRVYAPDLDQEFSCIPNLDNANYSVYSFTRAGQSYVGYVNQADPYNGDTGMTYGYELAVNVVPEPAGLALLAIGGLAICARCRKS